MHEPRSILVIRRKAVGDVLVSMAVPASLRRLYPSARLGLVVDRFAAPAVAGSPLLDDVLIYDRAAMQRGGWLSRGRAARRWLQTLRRERWDVVLDLMGTPQTALWTRATGAPVRVGRRRRFRSWAYTVRLPRDPGPSRFAGEVFLDWVRALGGARVQWQPVRVPRGEDVDAAARAWMAQSGMAEGPTVVLNASASWPAKGWPLANFAALARLLSAQLHARVLLAWGPGEEAAREAIVGQAQGAVVPLPATDLPQLAAHLHLADLIISTDSGPKHVAVAEGTPTLTLFGSTDPRGWQPPGEQHGWITHDVPCRPCDLTQCPVPGHPCLDLLTPEEVAQRAGELLQRAGALREGPATRGTAPGQAVRP